MPQLAFRRILTFFALVVGSTAIAIAQSETSAEIPAARSSYEWDVARSAGSAGHKLFVVTLDQPNRRQSCHVQSITEDKLVCSRFGQSPHLLPRTDRCPNFFRGTAT